MTIVADWIVDCSGRSATFSVGQGARRIKYDKLVAFWKMYQLPDNETDDDAWTTIESGMNGWFYTAATPNRQRIVVFLTDGDLPVARTGLHLIEWRQVMKETRLTSELLRRHQYEPVGSVRGIPASSARLDRPFGCHWVAAGDAAVAFDPLSSRGIAGAMTTGLNASGAVLEEHAGRSGAFAAYAEDITTNYIQYLSELKRRYRRRDGGPSEFWMRRARFSVNN